MKLAEVMLGDGKISICNERGEQWPDPNLIFNIDSLVNFIDLTIKNWEEHKERINKQTENLDSTYTGIILMENENTTFYIKCLFDLSVYYVAVNNAIKQINIQLHSINRLHSMNIKKDKKDGYEEFYNKMRLIRDKSFVHQNSEEIPNSMSKRVAMSWAPQLRCSNDKKPTCENYVFGSGGWFVNVGDKKIESDIDIEINGFSECANTAVEHVELLKSRVCGLYEKIRGLFPVV